ncbi:innexin unc-9-like isoform X6 [Brachionus plicatilis]|uniref:Innexin n=1 Tax=Brachionus plicatilis TaxID=10195 RepID=A0A3M7RDF5_BRAPC|nr:innexin unc-9-like isoform X6 [Brachionus plicatilis]
MTINKKKKKSKPKFYTKSFIHDYSKYSSTIRKNDEKLSDLILSHDRNDSCDDFVDRLNRKYTVVIILAFVTILTSKQYIGEPLACFCPAHFTGAHVEYTNNICWISRSFFVPIESISSNGINKINSYELNFKLNNAHQLHNTSHMKFLKIENIITYYPFLLLIQAILFYLPFFCWKNIIKKSVYDIGTLISLAFDSQKCRNQIEREILLKYLIKHLDRTNEYYTKYSIKDFRPGSASYFERKLSDRNGTGNENQTMFERLMGFVTLKPLKNKLNNYCIKKSDPEEKKSLPMSSYKVGLFGIYLIIKILYILNCFGQFLILNIFISGETKSSEENESGQRNDITFSTNTNIVRGFSFGYKTIVNLVESGRLFNEQNRLLMFHTVVFCDFKIRMLGDRLHRHTVQCVVPVNIYTEKIFTLLWFWLFLLNLLNIYNFLKWSSYYFSRKIKSNFLQRHLMRSNQTPLFGNAANSKSSKIKTALYTFLFRNNISRNDFEMDIIEHMTNNFLLTDNIFIIKLISKNTNEIITRELVTLLMENFREKCYILYDENTSILFFVCFNENECRAFNNKIWSTNIYLLILNAGSKALGWNMLIHKIFIKISEFSLKILNESVSYIFFDFLRLILTLKIIIEQDVSNKLVVIPQNLIKNSEDRII